MQYNILAGNLATPEHFPFAKPHLLDWSHRRQAILDRIRGIVPLLTPTQGSSPEPIAPVPSNSPTSAPKSTPALPTFLCFQELTDFYTWFEPQLRALGYHCLYVKRPSLHMSNWSGTEKQDGCLVAYQTSEIARVVDVEQVNYDDAHDRVALLALLEWRNPPPAPSPPYILLATTHLYWDSRRLSVQVNELDHLLTSLQRMQRKWAQAGPIPTVVAGDFNNGPSSQLYSRVVDHHTFHPPRTTPPPPASTPHYLYRYDSSYAAGGREPLATSVTNRRCWTIDYIFYSHEATRLTPHPAAAAAADTQPPTPHPLLRVRGTVPIPSEAELRSEAGPEGWNEDAKLKRAGQIGQGIPNSKEPSDHVPLLTCFEVVAAAEVREGGKEAGGAAGVSAA